MVPVTSRETQVKGLLQISIGDLKDPHAYFVFESAETAQAAAQGVKAAIQATDALAAEYWDQYIPAEKAKKCAVLQVFGLKPAHPQEHILAYVARKLNLVTYPIKTTDELIQRVQAAMQTTALANQPHQVELTKGDPTLFDFRNPSHFQGKLPSVIEEWLQASGR